MLDSITKVAHENAHKDTDNFLCHGTQ
jgi:hypothetical protein